MRSIRSKNELTAETQRCGDQRGEAWCIPIAVLLCFTASAAVVDRVAVVVGKIVVTESEVRQEVRLTEFLNGEPLNPGPEKRRAAAERLVDQQLIRNEMELGHYPEPSPGEVEAVLRRFQQEHYPSVNDLQAALKKYGITEEQLRQHLGWQLAAIRFTDLRFRSESPPPAEGAGSKTDGATGGAERAELSSKHTPSDAQTGAGLESGSVDQQLDAWLKEARSQVRIQFKKEAFQ